MKVYRRFSKNIRAEKVKKTIKKKTVLDKYVFELSNKKITCDLSVVKKLEGTRSFKVLKLNITSNRISPKKKKKHQNEKSR